MILAVFYLLVCVFVVATVLPLTSLRHWSVRGLDFPRLQISTALALLILFWFMLPIPGSHPVALLALVSALVYQLWWMLPYSEMHACEIATTTRLESTEGEHLKLLTSNVLMSNRDASRLLALIENHQPHVISILESDQWWQEQLDTLSDYPHRVACPQDNRYGMHLYSRLPLENVSIEFMVEQDVPSMHMQLLLPSGNQVSFHVVHPAPPAPGENEDSSERDVELVLLARRIEGKVSPVVVTGDLNDVAWSATTRLFRRLSGLLDPRIGRGMYNTFSADHFLLRWPLDHVFVSSHFRVTNVQRLPAIGSDHFPILMDLVLVCRDEQAAQLDPQDADEELEDDIMSSDVTREFVAGLNAGAASVTAALWRHSAT